MSELKLICQRLDKIIIDYFTTHDEFLKKQEQFDKEMKDGLLCMAKARYSMGAKSVGTLQYNMEEMVAGSKVKVQPTGPTLERDGPILSFSKINVGDHSDDDGDAKDTGVSTGSGEGLRRRHNVTEKECQDEDEEKVKEEGNRVEDLVREESKGNEKKSEENGKSHPSLPSPSDPLRWFGILVPPALREAQNCFQRATAMGCEVASLRSRLADQQRAVRCLLRRKEGIIGGTDDGQDTTDGFVIYGTGGYPDGDVDGSSSADGSLTAATT